MEAELALAELGLTVDGVIRAAANDPELGPTMARLTSREAKLRKALEYYGDERHEVPLEQAGSVYDRRGMVVFGSPSGEQPLHYVDGELVHGPNPEPEPVVDDPPPKLVRLPSLPARGGSPAKWEGKPIPLETFWELFRLAVEKGASGRALSKLTDERDELEFVNRNKAGNIVKWVKAHPARARQALDRHELPREVRATPDGVFPPTL